MLENNIILNIKATMNIGMILDNRFPPDPRVENEAVSLIEEKHNVFLYCIDYTQQLKKTEIINGINVYRAKLPKHLYSLSALAYTIPYYHIVLFFSIKKFIKTYQIDALHIHDMQIARSVFWLNKFFKLPIILDLHENRPEIMKFYYHVNTPLGKLLISPNTWKKFEFKYIKKADYVITVTDEARDYYVANIPVTPKKFHSVPNTIREAFYTDYKIDKNVSEKYNDYFTLLYLGETGSRRGLLTAISALQYIIPEIPNIKILIVGKSKEDYLLTDFINEKKYHQYVELAGWQSFELFQSYIKAADIGICPIHKNIHHNTTYANKIFQYMALGKPIIVSDCISQQNLVNKYHCGLIFKDRDEKDFADKVIDLAKNKELYKTLSTNAEATIKNNMNWEITSKSLKKIYENERNKKREQL